MPGFLWQSGQFTDRVEEVSRQRVRLGECELYEWVLAADLDEGDRELLGIRVPPAGYTAVDVVVRMPSVAGERLLERGDLTHELLSPS